MCDRACVRGSWRSQVIMIIHTHTHKLACFLQVVRKHDERAALMYSSALKIDPQVFSMHVLPMCLRIRAL